jgi:hypothetical protein
MYLHGPEEAFPWRGAALAAHITRFVNIAFGAATVALTAAVMFTIFPRRRALGFAAAGLVAFNPMFLYLSGAINNDVAAAAAGAAITWICVLIVRRGLINRYVVALGIAYGLALLTKLNLAFFLIVAELALLLRSVQSGSGKGAFRSHYRWVVVHPQSGRVRGPNRVCDGHRTVGDAHPSRELWPGMVRNTERLE